MRYLLILLLSGCAPQGYIDGQSKCEIEVERLKRENDNLWEKGIQSYEIDY